MSDTRPPRASIDDSGRPIAPTTGPHVARNNAAGRWPSRFAGMAPYSGIVWLALIGTAILYYPTLGYGFIWDDYHVARPYSLHEVIGAFSGSWDRTGIESPFYRPLTVVWFAARSLLLGTDASLYHLASMILFAVAVTLFGSLLFRLVRDQGFAILGTGFFLAHPLMVDTLVAWPTNQFHTLQVILFLGAFHWWLVCRGRRALWWLPIIATTIACALLKEDGVLLLIVILLIDALHRRCFGVRYRVPIAVYASALAIPSYWSASASLPWGRSWPPMGHLTFSKVAILS